MSEFNHRFNDLSFEERTNLMPHMIEMQILHYEQCKGKAVRAHRKLMVDYNDHINNLQVDLRKYRVDETEQGE